MKKIVFSIIAVLISICVYGQEFKLQAGLQGGYYNATNYYKAKPGKNISGDIRYFLTQKIFISSFASYGESWYYEEMDQVVNNYDYGKGTNAETFNLIVGLTVGYQVKFLKILDLSGQVGIGSYTEINSFSYQFEDYVGPFKTASTDLTFPLKLNIGLNVTKHINIGLTGGTNILPDYPFVGTHLGPRISYAF